MTGRRDDFRSPGERFADPGVVSDVRDPAAGRRAPAQRRIRPPATGGGSFGVTAPSSGPRRQRQYELHGGFGAMLDDALAGVYALGVVQLVLALAART